MKKSMKKLLVCLAVAVVSTGVMATAACILFARTGLIPAAILAAGLDLHLFLSLPEPSP